MIIIVLRRIIPVFSFVLLGMQLWAQPNVTPPSPNAAAFAKYGNTPVSLYTGVPEITVPLYDISIRDIKVPISLTYHASGVKVGEESSRVGLGWVLNAGGVISRNIIYLDDFQSFPQAFLDAGNLSNPIKQGPNSGPATFAQGGFIYKYYDIEHGSTPQQEDLSPFIVKTGIDPFWKPTDFEPDQFNYNFLGMAGRFVLNKGRDVILEKQEKIKIVPSLNGSMWTVTTSDGFIYKFEDYEYLIDTDNTSGYQQITAWYLSEIISPQNEHVFFNYTPFGQQHIIPVGSFHQEIYPRVISCIDMNCRGRSNQERILDGQQYSNIYLESITWSHGKVKFNVDADRQDLQGDIRITSMQIFKKEETIPFQETVFSYDYFLSPPVAATSVNDFDTGKPEQEIRRLKLTGLTKRALPIDDSEPEKYTFTYHEPTYYPGKNSFARDHWGYFNGRGDNTSFIPIYQTVVTGTGLPLLSDVIGVMGSNREASRVHAQTLSLKSITYPTKGTTTFFYETNTYEHDPNEAGTPSESEVFPDTKFLSYDAGDGERGTQLTRLDLRDQYVNQQGATTPITVRGGFRTNGECDALSGAPNVYFEVYHESNPNLTIGRVSPNGGRICANPNDPQCNSGCLICCPQSRFIDYVGAVTLPPGVYYIRAHMNTDEAQILDISAGYTYMVDRKKRPQFGFEPDGSIMKYRYGGGLRISRIEDYDPLTKKKNVKRYEYGFKVPNNDGYIESHSYGKRMVKPAYSYFDISWEKQEFTDANGVVIAVKTCLECKTLVRDSGHPLANYDGNSVGYSKVIEYRGENKDNGYSAYEFENVANLVRPYLYPFPTVDVPIKPPYSCTVKNSGNGNLLRQTQFTADDKKVMMTENFYTSKYRNITYGLTSRQIPVDPDLSPETASMMQLMLLYESMNSNFSYLSETSTTYFLPNEEEGVKTKRQFEYNNPEHLQLTREIKSESNLHKTSTEYKYPADYTDAQATAAILAMKGNKYMHSLPVEVTITDDSPDGTIRKVKHRS